MLSSNPRWSGRPCGESQSKSPRTTRLLLNRLWNPAGICGDSFLLSCEWKIHHRDYMTCPFMRVQPWRSTSKVPASPYRSCYASR
jgi:hypothetical protein